MSIYEQCTASFYEPFTNAPTTDGSRPPTTTASKYTTLIPTSQPHPIRQPVVALTRYGHLSTTYESYKNLACTMHDPCMSHWCTHMLCQQTIHTPSKNQQRAMPYVVHKAARVGSCMTIVGAMHEPLSHHAWPMHEPLVYTSDQAMRNTQSTHGPRTGHAIVGA